MSGEQTVCANLPPNSPPNVPAVIWAADPEAAIAAAQATRTIPIVFWSVPYPVEQHLVHSFARPGGNVTGVALFSGVELLAKRLEALRDCTPAVKRVAWIQTSSPLETVEGGIMPGNMSYFPSLYAHDLGLELQHYWIETRKDFDTAFEAITRSRLQALAMPAFTELFWEHRKLIIDFAMRNQLPNVCGSSQFVEAGGLVSYGADPVAMAVYSMSYVGRLLRGAKPADLPVERPNRYVLAVNLRTAKALGITIPQSLLWRADEVIQ